MELVVDIFGNQRGFFHGRRRPLIFLRFAAANMDGALFMLLALPLDLNRQAFIVAH
jgi:hypothetical protein